MLLMSMGIGEKAAYLGCRDVRLIVVPPKPPMRNKNHAVPVSMPESAPGGIKPKV